MKIDIKVPVLAESVSEATLMSWHKVVGDAVQRGENLIDIETDKVTLEVAAPANGRLVEILRPNDASVSSDELIARLETVVTDEADDKTLKINALPIAADVADDETLKVSPLMVDQVASRSEANKVPAHSPPSALPIAADAADDETLKMSPLMVDQVASRSEANKVPAHSPPSALPIAADAADDETLKMSPLMVDQVASRSEANKVPAHSPPKVESAVPQQAKLSPSLQVLLKSYGLRAEDIPRAKSERLSKADIMNHIARLTQSASMPAPREQSSPAPSAVAATKPTAKPLPTKITDDDTQEVVGDERVPMSALRRRIASRLLSAQQNNAILTTYNEVNMQPVIDLRTQYKEDFVKAHGVKLGFMSLFARASVAALKKFPIVNAAIDGNDIIYHHYFDIGIAVSAARGLVVPIIRDVSNLSLAEIEQHISAFVQKAGNGKLTIEDMTGGTFTITNGGVFGSLLSAPIINPPQSAILGMHSIQKRPVVEHDNIVIRPMMYIALSYDHRLIDGREAVQFLITIKQCLENPARLLLQI